MEDRLIGRLRGAVSVMLVVCAAALLGVGMLVGMATRPTAQEEWPETSEFRVIESGAPRFSTHETNDERWTVVVDRETGCQYLSRDGGGIVQLTDADGSPLLVDEAGE